MNQNNRPYLLLFLLMAFAPIGSVFAQVGIGTTAPDASAELEIKSTSRGLLTPKMTTAQMNAIAAPATGLTLYNTDSSTFCVYTGSKWLQLLTSQYNATSGSATSSTDSVYSNGSGYAITGFRSASTTVSTMTGSVNANTTIKVTVDITVTSPRDISYIYQLYLVSPAGYRVALTDNAELSILSGNSLSNTVFSSAASNSLSSGTSPFTGTFKISESISKLFGSSLNGQWTLLLEANSASFSLAPYMKINSWTLDLSGAAAGDDLGNHSASYNIKLNDHYLSNDGDAEGIRITSSGYVGINTSSPSTQLHVNGTTRTLNLMMTSGASNGYVLKSDASGNASWVNPTSLSNGNWTTSGTNQYSALSGNVGIGTTSPLSKVHLDGGNLLATGTFGSGNDIEVTADGSQMYFNPKKAAFRAGYSESGSWNNSLVGDYSAAFGAGTMASGSQSFASGLNSIASGAVSNAMGMVTTASGTYSFAAGQNTTASGTASASLGVSISAKSYGEVSVGLFNTNYTPTSTSSWSATDRLFVIGNGSTAGNRSDALTVLKSGYVGIGTSSPGQNLEVNGTTKTTSLQVTSGATNGYVLQSDGSGNASWVNPTTLAGGNWTTNGSDQYSALSGNVGIGTSSVSAKLHVYTAGANNSILSQSGSGTAYLSAASVSGSEASSEYKTYSSGTVLSRWTAGKSNDSEAGSNSGSDYFVNRYDYAGSFLGQPLRIARSTGYVGIAQPGPASTFEVNGSTGMKVKASQAAGTNNPDATGTIWIYSSGTGTITLPATANCTNRIYTIVNNTGATRTISSFVALGGSNSTSIGSAVSLQLVSDGTNWYQIK